MALSNFSDRLKQLRTEKGLTQAQVSKRIGVTRSVISAYENELRYPSYDVLIGLSCLYGVSTDYLLCKNERRCIDVSDLTDEECAAIRQMIFLLIKARKGERT